MNLKEFYNYHVKNHFKTGFLVMLLVFFLSSIFFLLNSDIAMKVIEKFMESVGDNIVLDGKVSAFGLIKNNITACLVMILLGLIPYLFLPYFSLIINGAVIGAALGMIVAKMGMTGYLAFILSVVPHGIFEIPAIVLSFALGVSVCKYLMDKMNKKPTTTGKTFFINLSKMFFFVVIPLLLVAGFVEAYFTPIIASIVMWG